MSEALQSFHFLRPLAFVLLPFVVLIWWMWQRRSDPLRGWRTQIDPDLLHALVEAGDTRPNRHLGILAGWLIAVFALAGPSWRPEPSPFADDATPLMILLKADVSMDTPDPPPSRQERARMKITDLAAARKGQPLGLIAYSGSAHLVLPPTRDTEVVATMAAQITSEIMPEKGDRLDLAITRASEVAGDTSAALLVVTDTAASATPELSEAYRSAGSPAIQILAIAPEDASTDSLRPLASALHADIVPMRHDESDIDKVVQFAARPPVAKGADGTEQWEDGGFYFMPFLAVLALFTFRRETRLKEEVS